MYVDSVYSFPVALKKVPGDSFTLSVVRMVVVGDVTLLSGQRVAAEAVLTALVQSLAELARRALGVGRGQLFTSFGSVLDVDATLEAANLQTRDCLTLQVGTVHIRSGFKCFAAILGDGSVVTHGAMRATVVTAVPCKTSCGTCNRSKSQMSRNPGR